MTWSREIITKIIEPPIRVDLQPPPETLRMSARNVATKWITMPTDHFDPHNRDTFEMVSDLNVCAF